MMKNLDKMISKKSPKLVTVNGKLKKIFLKNYIDDITRFRKGLVTLNYMKKTYAYKLNHR